MAYPYYQYPNPYQQQSYLPLNYQPMNPSQSPVINQSGIIWVSGEQEATIFSYYAKTIHDNHHLNSIITET